MRIGDSEIEVLVFDLFGVLISFDDDLVTSRLARHCADPDDASVRLHKITASHDIITGATSLSQVHAELTNELGFTLPWPEFEAAWLRPYHEAIPGMAALVEGLSQHYRLVLLSNVDRDYWRVVRNLQPELGHFESLLVSCDLGMAKPDPAIYRHACDLTDTEPARCLFIDDTAANVEAARRVGLHGHHFRGVEGLRTALQQADAEGI